jgi:hypothetical protein
VRINSRRMFLLLLSLACIVAARSATAQSLEEKLRQTTDYVPHATGTVAQLVEVAQKFKLPAGIEWIEREASEVPAPAPPHKRAVREVLEEILRGAPDYRVQTDGGLVRIYSPAAAEHPFNFLNLRLEDYSVKKGDLFAAEDQLRWAIRFTLEPEEYANGYGGGYGHGSNDVFEFPEITLEGSNLTIREVLNRIALAQGNALWVATIKGEDLQADKPWWETTSEDGDHLPITAGWNFQPLANIDELANEQLAVDLTNDEIVNQRMSTIPLILKHGLTGDSGGAMNWFSTSGFSFRYSALIEKTGENYVDLVLHLTVKRPGEIEHNFEKKVRVTRGKVAELSPEPRTRIRCYIEPRSEAMPNSSGALARP